MSNYLLAYHGGGMPQTEQERTKVNAAWGQWYKQLGSAVVDGGNPVGQTMMISSDGSTMQGGGPNPVSGYTIIQANSMADAVKMSQGCPVLSNGGSVEVGETFNVVT
jgi:hypothetical protein